VFLGGGDDLRRIERQAGEAGLGDRVVFRGFVENPYPAMRSCEAFVSCSKSEGISNALLEAMYLERAVVVTPAGGTREAVRDGENGLIAADAEAATVGALMNRIYRDERLRRNLGRRASRTVIDHFSLERMAEEIGRYLGELLTNGNPAE
jgi:glycosyltransferase involved in cell wall biosynthesis